MRCGQLLAGLLGTPLLVLVAGSSVNVGQTATNAAQGHAPAEPRSVKLPFTMDHNRMTVDVEFVRPDGAVRTAHAWVDTGNQFVMVSQTLARDLGLDVSGLKEGETQHSVESASPVPPIRLPGMPLDIGGVKVLVHPGAQVRLEVSAEANLPASALRHDHVVFDYPARRLAVARPGALKPRGVAFPCRVNVETGLFQVEATLDGESVQLGVDNGSAGTWVSNTLTGAWQKGHPDWPCSTGAVGLANFFGFGFKAKGVLMRLPELGLGPLRVRNGGLLGLDQGLFDWYSKKTAGPVVGFIGANVLKAFRVEIDYPNQMTYWEAGQAVDAGDLDIVGLKLRPEGDGSFTVAGVATKGGKPTVDVVQPGDTLIRVETQEAADAKMGAVVGTLRGKPGATRTLVIEREGRLLTIEAKVTRFP